MKTLVLFLTLAMFGTCALAQKETAKDTLSVRELSEDGSRYRASNGKTYAVGATIQLGAGTETSFKDSGSFRNVRVMIGNFVSGFLGVPKLTGEELPITEFRREKNGNKRVYAVSKRKGDKHAVFIEAGLATGEVK